MGSGTGKDPRDGTPQKRGTAPALRTETAPRKVPDPDQAESARAQPSRERRPVMRDGAAARRDIARALTLTAHPAKADQ